MKDRTLMQIFTIPFILISIGMLSAQVNVDISDISINDKSIFDNHIIKLNDSENLPITVKFKALEDFEDMRVMVSISDENDIFSASSSRFMVLSGVNYIQRMIIDLPDESKYKPQTYNLTVRFSAKGEESIEKTYEIRMLKNNNFWIIKTNNPKEIEF